MGLDYDFGVRLACLRSIASLETRLGTQDVSQDSMNGLKEKI